jgi:hypothetical protein
MQTCQERNAVTGRLRTAAENERRGYLENSGLFTSEEAKSINEPPLIAFDGGALKRLCSMLVPIEEMDCQEKKTHRII